MCREQQSPIDLVKPIVTDFGKNQLKINWKPPIEGEIEPQDDGLHIVFGGDHRHYIVLDQVKFHLVAFHFHHPSEHWIDSKQQTLELHIVHQHLRECRRAVVGIFVDVAADGAATTPGLVDEIIGHLGRGKELGARRVITDPNEWLPNDTTHYYRYEGSLTTPAYDENVSWAILKEPLLIPKQKLSQLIKLLRHPARLPQPLNRRFLLANFGV